MDDPRLTPARGDLAAKYLEGKVKAARFVEGEELEVVDAIAPLREAASPVATQLTQALRGERVTVYDRNGEGFCLGPAEQRRLCRLAARSRAGKAWGGTDAQGQRAANFCLSRSLNQAAADRRPDNGRKSGGGARGRWLCDHAGRPMPAAAASRAPRRQRVRFRRHCRTLRRHALPLGRQEQSWHRLFGPCAGIAERRRHRLPARQRHAAGWPWPDVERQRGEKTAARRSDFLERPCRDRARWRDDRARQRASYGNGDRECERMPIARIKAAGSEVTAIKRL